MRVAKDCHGHITLAVSAGVVDLTASADMTTVSIDHRKVTGRVGQRGTKPGG